MATNNKELANVLTDAANALNLLLHPDPRDGDVLQGAVDSITTLRKLAEELRTEPERKKPEMHKRLRVTPCNAKLRIPADGPTNPEEVLFECQGEKHDDDSWHHSKGHVHVKGGRALEYTISWRDLGRKQLHVGRQ